MPIELRCSQCDTLLRVPDGSEGRETRCPSCGTMLRIPGTSASQYPDSQYPDSQYGDSAAGQSAAGQSAAGQSAAPGGAAGTAHTPPGGRSAEQEANPFSSPTTSPDAVQPGSSPFATGPPAHLDLGDLLGRSWDTFQRQIGTILVGWVAMTFCMIVVAAIAGGITVAVGFIASGGFANETTAVIVMLPIGLVAAVGCVILFSWISLGWQRFILQLVRTANAEFATIFSNGRGVFALIISGIIASLPTFLVGAMCIAPWAALDPGPAIAITILVILVGGVFCAVIAMMWSQCMWLIADRLVGPIESLGMSHDITKGHKLYLFLLFFLQSVIGFVLGLIPFYIGALLNFLVVQPYFVVVFATTYLTLTGQPVMRYTQAAQPMMAAPVSPAATQPYTGQSGGGQSGGDTGTAPPPPDFG